MVVDICSLLNPDNRISHKHEEYGQYSDRLFLFDSGCFLKFLRGGSIGKMDGGLIIDI